MTGGEGWLALGESRGEPRPTVRCSAPYDVGRSVFAEPQLHLVQHVVDQAGLCLRSGKAEGVAAGAGLSRDRQALAQLQQAAGAAGGGVGGLSQHIHQDGAEGGPLGLTPLADLPPGSSLSLM